MSEQKKVDDLFDQLSAEQPKAEGSSPAASAEAASPVPPAEEAVSTPSQAAATETPAPSASTPKAKPKRGVFGSIPEPKFGSLEEALKDRMSQTEKRLRINEDLMMTYLFNDKINETYYRMWRSDANRYFRNICVAKHRLARMKKNQAKPSSQ